MTQISLPKTNQTGANEWADVEDNDTAIKNVVNGNLDNGNLASNAGVVLSKLSSGTSAQIIVCNASGVPTYVTATGDVTTTNAGVTAIGAGKVTGTMLAASTQVAYRSIANAVSSIEGGVAAGTYILGSDTVAPASPFTSGSDITNNASTFPPYFYFDDADWTVGTLTPKLRLRAQVAANATQPTITFTFGLYPITVAGGASALTMTLGTVVTNSTVAIASPAASTVTSGVTSDFTVPADGAYALGVVTNNTLTASNASLLSAQLQVRNV